ncbi:MAG: carbon-nitrogen hydrolase family protein [Rubrivivax sp.]
MNLKIALVQLRITHGNPADNLARMDGFIAEAAAKGAQLVVFPEDAVTGPLSAQIAHLASAPMFLSECQALAVKHRVDLVPGTWVVAEPTGLHNVAHYIASDGSVLGSYRKINLWPTEQAQLTPGAAVSVFPTAHGMVGLCICWDLSFAPLFAQMKAQGAQLVISPTYWSFTRPAPQVETVEDGEIALIDSLCLTRAFEHGLAFAYCNAAGDLKAEGLDAVLSGRSQVTHPLEKVLVRAEGNDECVLVTTVRID